MVGSGANCRCRVRRWAASRSLGVRSSISAGRGLARLLLRWLGVAYAPADAAELARILRVSLEYVRNDRNSRHLPASTGREERALGGSFDRRSERVTGRRGRSSGRAGRWGIVESDRLAPLGVPSSYVSSGRRALRKQGRRASVLSSRRGVHFQSARAQGAWSRYGLGLRLGKPPRDKCGEKASYKRR